MWQMWSCAVTAFHISPSDAWEMTPRELTALVKYAIPGTDLQQSDLKNLEADLVARGVIDARQ
jgi:hypothetical protein